jgi:hypothetical protein
MVQVTLDRGYVERKHAQRIAWRVQYDHVIDPIVLENERVTQAARGNEGAASAMGWSRTMDAEPDVADP